VASQLAAKERSSPRPEASLKAQAEAVQRQMEKERAEHQRRLELLETQLESSSLDNQVRIGGTLLHPSLLSDECSGGQGR
jgi:hypothetical protein